jgi:molybdopterin/thiamine biosynthesis adenylyltransferase
MEEKCLKFNKIYRRNTKIIYCETSGVLGSYFVDFGSSYDYKDLKGDQQMDFQTYKVSGIIKRKKTIKCEIVENSNQLSVNDIVKFKSNSMECEILELNSEGILILKPVGKFIPLDEYDCIEKINKTINVSFKSLENEINNIPKFSRGRINLNFLYKCFSFEMNETIDELRREDPNIDKIVECNREYSPPYIVSIIGGIVSQEAIKGITGCYEPMTGLQTLSFEDLLPNDCKVNSSSLENMNILVVGVGATGSELLKNLVLMNATTGNGSITIVDPDHISTSNLSRQLWYHEEDVNKSKVEVCKRELLKINADLKIEAIQDYISLRDESFVKLSKFDHESFWKHFDVVVSCVDSFKARKDISLYCAAYGVPMIECGTLGLSATSTLFIPHQSEIPFQQSQDSDSNEIFNCTTKAIPYHSKHCFQWAVDKLQEILSRIPLYSMASYHEVFTELFDQGITSLIKEHHVWEKTKKPIPIRFSKNQRNHSCFQDLFNKILSQVNFLVDFEDQLHLGMIQVIGNLRCLNFSIPTEDDLFVIYEMISNFKPAVVTTTSIISALISMEVFKISQKNQQLKQNQLSLSSNFLIRSPMEFKENPKEILEININEKDSVFDFLKKFDPNQRGDFMEFQRIIFPFDELNEEELNKP